MTSKTDDVNKIMEYLIRSDDASACQWEVDAWPGADELLDNMFSLEGGPLGLLEQPLPDLPLYPDPTPRLDVPASSCSDSGLSSDHADLTDYDQQLSPFLIQNSCADDPLASPSQLLSPRRSATSQSGSSCDRSPLYSGDSSGSPQYAGEEGSPQHAGVVQGGPQHTGAGQVYVPAASWDAAAEFVELPAVDAAQVKKPTPKIIFKDTFHNSPARKRRGSLAPNTAVVQPKLQKPAAVHSPVTVTSKPPTVLPAQPQRPLKLANVQVMSPPPRVFSRPNDAAPARKVIRVAPMAGNPRSILLPVTIKDMKDLRSIKIINAADLKNASNIKLAAANLLSQSKMHEFKVEKMESADFDYDSNNATMDESQSEGDASDEEDWRIPEPASRRGQYPRLVLTAEERKLLAREGIKMPASYPLTKHEERELKRIRRKIRNKISAQDSRKRKKEYVDGLEDRVKQCSDENQTLIKRIKILQSQNQSLTAQLKRLQHVLSGGGGGGKGAQPATCLLVLLMSVALVALPSLREAERAAPAHTGPHALAAPPAAAPPLALRRALLSAAPHKVPSEEVVLDDGEFNMEELISFPKPHSDHDYQVIKLDRKVAPSGGGGLPPGYLDIPIDEDWPPNLKRRIKHHFDLDDGPDYLPVIKDEDYGGSSAPPPDGTADYKTAAELRKAAEHKMAPERKMAEYAVGLGGKLGELMPLVAVKSEDIITEVVEHEGRNITELRSFVVNSTNRM